VPSNQISAKQVPGNATVELDVFSGRSNPTWVLSDEQVATLATQLASLPSRAASSLANNLGYRGFVVELDQAGNPVTVRIQNELVEVVGPSGRSYFQDDDRALERWMLNSGRDSLPADIVQLVQDELDQ
jgi:hypothetical protein